MKIFITTLTITIFTVLSAQSVFACSQPPTTVLQQSNLAKVLNSEVFRTHLQEQTKVDRYVAITGIDFGGGIHVSLSNGCVIMSTVKYGVPAAPGLCPRFIGVSSETLCQ